MRWLWGPRTANLSTFGEAVGAPELLRGWLFIAEGGGATQ
jgi:hypothetical protein